MRDLLRTAASRACFAGAVAFSVLAGLGAWQWWCMVHPAPLPNENVKGDWGAAVPGQFIPWWVFATWSFASVVGAVLFVLVGAVMRRRSQPRRGHAL